MYTRLYRSGNYPAPQPPTDVSEETPLPTTVATYGPPRRKDAPWVRDEKLGKPQDTITEAEYVVKDKEVKAPKEELSKTLAVESVGVNIKENTRNHRTDQYACTEMRMGPDDSILDPELVVRRGQAFTININFNQTFSREKHHMHLVMMTGKDPTPSDFTLVQLEPLKPTKHAHGWKSAINSIQGSCVFVDITPSSSCVIGEWSLCVMTSPPDKALDKMYCFEFPDDINILLNPWCKDDVVYLEDEKLSKEYVLNDKGVLFYGNYRQIGCRTWNFGQFDVDIMEICFHLLRKANGNSVNAAAMSDPVRIARAISGILNYHDDGGVLVGNWSGEYSDGKKPTHWNGSPKILQEYFLNHGRPVCYGQCWVFSGLVTTVCRALGLPCRSVTNFKSAHNTDKTLSIDTVMEEKDGEFTKIDELSNDSIWNFHVWNDVWMARRDLGKGYDGWQAIDATPQELSGGVYRCGPAPLAAIKKGDCSVNYDTEFVFAEVNADRVTWNRLSENKWQMLYSDTNDVGQFISTKIPDGEPFNADLSVGSKDAREDITHLYKFQEGTLQERLAVMQANRASKVDRKLLNPQNKDIKLKLLDEDGIMVGESFSVKMKIKKLCEEKRTIAKLTVDVYMKRYNGKVEAKVTSHVFKDIELAGERGEKKVITHEVKGETYVPYLIEQCAMDVRITALVKETGGIFIKTDDFRLRRPDLKFEASKDAKKGTPFDLTVSFKNSLPHPLTNCTLDLDGVVEDKEMKLPDIPGSSLWKHVVKVTVNRSGRHQISGSFDSKELQDISGYLNFTLKE